MNVSDQQRETPPGAGRNGNVPPPAYRWKKGESGNPGGRPKGESLTARMRRVLEQEHGGKEIADLLAERFVKEALSGKFPFAKELIDRLEGKVVDTHEISGPGGAPLGMVMTDEEKIEAALKVGRLDLLSPRLRQIAEARKP